MPSPERLDEVAEWLSTLKLLLQAWKVAPELRGLLDGALKAPTKQDRERIVNYVRRLEERRVFSAHFNSEVVEVCIGSLSQVKDFTDETLAQVDHPGARAALGAIIDQVRLFLDAWSRFKTARIDWDDYPRRPDPFVERNLRGGQLAAFFQDLGELRSKMRLLVSILIQLAPKAAAPNLLGQPEDE
jgi:hypothetical protein